MILNSIFLRKKCIVVMFAGFLAAFFQFATPGLCAADEGIAETDYDIEDARQENQRIRMKAELETQLSDTLGAGGFLMAFNSAVNMNYSYEPGASTEDYEEVWMRQKGDEGIYLGCNKAGYMMAIEMLYSTEHYSLDPLKGKFMTTFKVLGIPEEQIPKLEQAFNDVMNTRESRIYDAETDRTFICSRFTNVGGRKQYVIVIRAQKGNQTHPKVQADIENE